MTRTIFLTVLLLALAVPSGYGAGDIDRAAVDFKTPEEIKWVRNAAGTNESAVLFGDPSKPGPYVVRVKWLPGNMSRPHFHPNDRFFAVLSGTWWMGTGEKFDPESTVPAHLGGRSSGWSTGFVVRAMARSMACSSSRTLPGQS